MSKAFGIAFGCAVAIIAVLLWVGFDKTKGNHLAPEGRIGKVRVQGIDENNSFVVVDFNAKNDSDRDFVVRSVTISIDGPDGPLDGQKVAAGDLTGAFKSYPGLGQQFNEAIKDRDAIAAHQEVDRMVAARFYLPAEKVEGHKVTLRAEDVTGAEFVFTK
jgi:hypothetical protein